MTNGVIAGGTEDPFEAQSLEKLRTLKKYKNYVKNKQKAKTKKMCKETNNITRSGMDDLERETMCTARQRHKY